jgi:hypothetical protein
MTENASSVSANPVVREQRRNRLLAGLAGVVVLAGVAAGAYWWLHASHFVSTDNAYAAAEVAQVTPSIGGTVLEVLVKDTQAVSKAMCWCASIPRTPGWHWPRPRPSWPAPRAASRAMWPMMAA